MQKTEEQLSFNGVKVFSATMVRDRQDLGEKVTTWLREKQRAGAVRVTDYIVSQSSDSEFHCLSITVFFVEGEQAAKSSANGKRRLNFERTA